MIDGKMSKAEVRQLLHDAGTVEENPVKRLVRVTHLGGEEPGTCTPSDCKGCPMGCSDGKPLKLDSHMLMTLIAKSIASAVRQGRIEAIPMGFLTLNKKEATVVSAMVVVALKASGDEEALTNYMATLLVLP